MPTFKNNLTLSFDIGHSSIGWAVLDQQKPHPNILGCGSVIFPKDDCLASARRGHRRTRRNIRSTRQRIRRMKQLLEHLGVLTPKELDRHPGHPAPHWLAARALISDKPQLKWPELWDVLRWYAHNRGYDGNSRWSRQDQNDDDTEKERVAKSLLDQHQTKTMAQTICAELGIDPSSSRFSSNKPFKTLNAAFPRHIVRDEVLAILEKHKGHLAKLDDAFIACLISRDRSTDEFASKSITVPELKLPKRYRGGLLFGQLVPRFDNRIIGKCPISGDKIPNKACREFLEYRWAMLLANIRSAGKPLSSEHRKEVDALMRSKGRLTPTELRNKVEELTGTDDNNIKSSFEIHPDSKDALVLDPAEDYFHKAQTKPKQSKDPAGIWVFWPHLTEETRNRIRGRWRKRRTISLQWMLVDAAKNEIDSSTLLEAIDQAFAADQKKPKPSYTTRQHLLNQPYGPDWPSGRAPYSRPVMKEVVRFVLSTDRHPTEAGSNGKEAGPIYRSPDVLRKERERTISDLTNNHLLRQRLNILAIDASNRNSLLTDIINKYAEGDSTAISDIVVEVARDLQEYSGMTSKEMAGELTKRLSHFKEAVKYLEDKAPDLEITGSLIRKCRIAMDMDWKCPFTGESFDAYTLPKLEREHIIPYADRPTNAMDAQVLTWPEVNRMKKKRTALEFIIDAGGNPVDGKKNLSLFTRKQYEEFVDKLKVAKKFTYPDDFRRQSARKKWLLMEHYDGKNHNFTQGALTQTSHLNRLSQSQLAKRFTDPETGDCSARIHALPGQVTAEARKVWDILHTLDTACPECAGKNKTEIRGITHLHHALDAATLGLIQHYLPGTIKSQKENEKGTLWRALLQRRKSPDDISLLLRTGVFRKSRRPDRQGTPLPDAELVDLEPAVKNQLANRLGEKRVVQHIPADQSGAALEQNPWRVRKVLDHEVILTQWNTGGTGDKQVSFHWDEKRQHGIYQRKKEPQNKELQQIDKLIAACDPNAFTSSELRQLRRGTLKIASEARQKIIGLKPGKLKKNKSVLVISDNFGLSTGSPPRIIRHHEVPKQLSQLARENSGRVPPILKIGSIIDVASGTWKGIWRITSIKETEAYGLSVDVATLDGCKLAKGNARILQMIEDGMKIIKPGLTGLNPTD